MGGNDHERHSLSAWPGSGHVHRGRRRAARDHARPRPGRPPHPRRQIDERFDALIAELYDVADQCRHLCQLVVATFLVFVIALSIVIGLVIMS
jgi:hypothetical protein